MTDTIFDINGKTVDMSKALPMTLGDWSDIQEQHGVGIADLGNYNMPAMCKVLFFVCHKSNSEVTMDDVRNIQISKVLELMKPINQSILGGEETDTNFLTS